AAVSAIEVAVVVEVRVLLVFDVIVALIVIERPVAAAGAGGWRASDVVEAGLAGELAAGRVAPPPPGPGDPARPPIHRPLRRPARARPPWARSREVPSSGGCRPAAAGRRSCRPRPPPRCRETNRLVPPAAIRIRAIRIRAVERLVPASPALRYCAKLRTCRA